MVTVRTVKDVERLSDLQARTVKVAVVTGAARRGGIGRAIARQLLLDGHAVVISDLARAMESHPDYQSAARGELEAAVAELAALELGEVAGCGCDVRSSADADALVAFALQRFGRIDVLVNNAGIAIGLGPVVELSDQDWQVNLEVMASGVFYCSRAAARPMIAQGHGGRIVTVASQAGKLGQPLLGAYSAAKFAAIGLTQVLAHELGAHGITVNAVCPGTVLTPLLDLPGGIFDVYPKLAGVTREQYERKVLRTIPLRRFETPEDVAAAVGFLASDAAAYITGEALNVSGGQTMA
jgi:NAD(P)-dependent dehydrogenase (short-subunit alcohol dehydrogenase family)